MTDDEKKAAFKKLKREFALHVALLEADGMAKPDALATAYGEGREGLATRRNPVRFAK